MMSSRRCRRAGPGSRHTPRYFCCWPFTSWLTRSSVRNPVHRGGKGLAGPLLDQGPLIPGTLIISTCFIANLSTYFQLVPPAQVRSLNVKHSPSPRISLAIFLGKVALPRKHMGSHQAITSPSALGYTWGSKGMAGSALHPLCPSQARAVTLLPKTVQEAAEDTLVRATIRVSDQYIHVPTARLAPSVRATRHTQQPRTQGLSGLPDLGENSEQGRLEGLALPTRQLGSHQGPGSGTGRKLLSHLWGTELGDVYPDSVGNGISTPGLSSLCSCLPLCPVWGILLRTKGMEAGARALQPGMQVWDGKESRSSSRGTRVLQLAGAMFLLPGRGEWSTDIYLDPRKGKNSKGGARERAQGAESNFCTQEGQIQFDSPWCAKHH